MLTHTEDHAWARSGQPDLARAFRTDLRVVDDWHKLPFYDPGLSLELVRPNWMSEDAGKLSEEVVANLDEGATDHARSYGQNRSRP